MDELQREILRRLKWRAWVAKGVLYGLGVASALSLLMLLLDAPRWQAKWPALQGGVYWLYLSLGALSLASILLALRRHPRAVVLIAGVGLLVIAFESWALGLGVHLLRVPMATLLACWAAHELHSGKPRSHAS